MSHSVFISYSRQEAPLVDVLVAALERAGLQVWVDYHNLVPGQPWQAQILAGIQQAEVFLLLVSKRAILSPNVQLEYQQALAQQRRVLLVIFEAVSLPPALQACEWIDLRGDFRKRVQALFTCLEQPSTPARPAPQSGFKASLTVWLTFGLSLLLVIASIPAWWTLYIPALLIPLPFQILKRDFHYYRVRFAILTLPLILVLDWGFFSTYTAAIDIISVAVAASLFLSPAMLVLLASRGMRIWGKPRASAPRFTNPYLPPSDRPAPVPFFIEYAPEDRKYAEALIQGLTQYGHPHLTNSAGARACFAVISQYKATTALDPETQTVYPVIVQDAPVLDEKLQRIQWIDFRRGVRNLNSLAQLLPNPVKLLEALGVVPLTGQTLLPRVIQIWDYFLTLLAVFSFSIWLPLLFDFGRQFVQLDYYPIFFALNILITILTLRTVLNARRALLTRRGKRASLWRLSGAVLLTGFYFFVQTVYVINVILAAMPLAPTVESEFDVRGAIILFLPFSYLLGLLLMTVISLWNWRDLTRWFPAPTQPPPNPTMKI